MDLPRPLRALIRQALVSLDGHEGITIGGVQFYVRTKVTSDFQEDIDGLVELHFGFSHISGSSQGASLVRNAPEPWR